MKFAGALVAGALLLAGSMIHSVGLRRRRLPETTSGQSASHGACSLLMPMDLPVSHGCRNRSLMRLRFRRWRVIERS